MPKYAATLPESGSPNEALWNGILVFGVLPIFIVGAFLFAFRFFL